MATKDAVKRRLKKNYKVGGITFDDNRISFKGVKDKRRTDQFMEKLFIIEGKRKAQRRSSRKRKG